MAIPFSDLVGNPFPDSVKEELERRRDLRQRFETSATLYNPYFKLRRREKMSYQEKPVEEYQFGNRKFWELERVSKGGLNDIEETDNKKAPLGITDVNIEVTDYTFHTVTVNFTIPNINDWQIFKETWLKFGAPVEYEFGRFSPVNVENQNEDIRPNYEVREGLVANFEWNLGESNRTINGSMTIYSATWVQLMQEAHSDVDLNSEMVNIVRENLKKPFLDLEDPIQSGSPITIRRQESNVKLDKYFYSALKATDAETIKDELEKVTTTTESTVNRTSSYRIVAGLDGSSSRSRGSIRQIKRFNTRYPADMVETVSDNLTDRIFRKQKATEVKRVNGLTETQIEQTRQVAEAQVNGTMIQETVLVDGEPVINNITPTLGYVDNVDEDGQLVIQQFNAFKAFYQKGGQERYVLNEKYKNVGNTTLQKYAISSLNLKEGLLGNVNTEMYFYASLRFVNDVVNKMMRQFYNEDELDILSKLILTDVPIRDLSYLGLGSAYPDRVIINPWGRTYSKNPDYDPFKPFDDTPTDAYGYKPNRAYTEDDDGDVRLLEDIYISADTLMTLVENSKSPMGFVQNVIDEIHGSTKNLIKLIRTAKNDSRDGRITCRHITYFDASIISDKSSENQAYHTFSLFDAKEKIRDVDVQTDLSDAFAKLAFFRSRGTVQEDDNLFYYAGNFYNEDGTPAPDPLSPPPDLERRPQPSDATSRDPEVNPFILDISNTLDEYESTQPYRKKGNDIVQSLNTKYESSFDDAKERVNTGQTGEFEALTSISFIAYIQSYFEVLIDLYSLTSDPLNSSAGTVTIPLKADVTLDGISGIFSGQVFKIDLSSFPMAYNIENVTPLFVVSTLQHTFSGNDWQTTIGAMLFIPPRAQADAIVNSGQLLDLISSKNARLEIINDVFEQQIAEIIES